MKNSIGFICPVCKKPLVKNEKNYICENGHNFDIAKSGYVNLVTGSSRKNHGDNRLMTDSRREFLSKGYYEPLRRALCDTVQKYAAQKGNVLDCGCGEGYYTKAVADVLPLSSVFGTDISKDELTVAAKRAKNVDFAVASSFSLPFADSSIDILLEIFSPYCGAEFKRVLKKDAAFIMVIPLENHLWELKCAAYDTPYKNEVSDTYLDGFDFTDRIDVKYKFDLNSGEDISSLFKMTPYYYKTGVKEQKRVEELEKLSVSAEFGILVYRKI